MPVGSEWLLFAEWNPRLNGFTLFYREHGAIEIKGAQVVTSEHLPSAVERTARRGIHRGRSRWTRLNHR
jgi:hypothetical protein